MPHDLQKSKIYASVLRRCRRLEFPSPPWNRFKPDRNTFLAPEDTSATLALLREEFGDEALMASRVAVRDKEGQCRLSAGLQPGRVVVAFRHGSRAERIDLLTSVGCLSGTLPILADDNWTSAALNAQPDYDRTLFVAFSMADVAALRALGLAATLAGRPERIRPGRPFFLNGSKNNKAIVGWSPFRLTTEMPAGFREFCAHIAGLETHLGVSIENWFVWRPDDDAIESIRFALTYGQRADVCNCFVEATDQYSPSAVVDGSINERPLKDDPGSLQEAWRTLQDLPDRDRYNSSTRAEAWREYQSRHERDFVAPLIRAALAEDDLHHRDLLFNKAENTRMRHYVGARVADDLLRQPFSEAWRSQLPIREIQLLLAITDRSLALNRALQRSQDQCRSWGARWGRRSRK